MAVWHEDALAWADLERTIDVFWHRWFGVTSGGTGYTSDWLHEPSAYVWESGRIRQFGGPDPTMVRAASSDGLVLGAVSGIVGVWTPDEAFHPIHDERFRYCVDIADGGLAICRTPYLTWVLARLHFDDGGGASPGIDGVLAFFDDAVEDGSLVGAGPGASAVQRREALRRMLEEARAMLDAGAAPDDVCGHLGEVFRRSDGASPPPDFVEGPAAPTLAGEVRSLMDEVGCA